MTLAQFSKADFFESSFDFFFQKWRKPNSRFLDFFQDSRIGVKYVSLVKILFLIWGLTGGF